MALPFEERLYMSASLRHAVLCKCLCDESIPVQAVLPNVDFSVVLKWNMFLAQTQCKKIEVKDMFSNDYEGSEKQSVRFTF
jgi:hypothetical protein